MLVTAQFPPGLCFGLKTLIDCGDCGAFRTAMAILAGQGPEEMKITVRNTFLNVLDDEEDPLFRTSSDPLGGQCEMQARHIAKAKQATSSKLFTHDESNETNETASTTLEDVALCRSRTWDPLEPHFIEASQDGSPTDVSESPTACPLQVGATAPGMMPTTMPVVRSPAPSVTSPFAGGLAFLNSQPSDLSPFTAPWQPPKMTALAHPFIPSERSNFDANQQLFFPSSLIHQEADVGRDVDDSQMKDRGRKGYGKGSKGKEKGDQFGSRAYSFSSNGKGRMPAVHRSQDPSRGYSSAKEAIVLESSRPMVSSKGPQFAFHHRFHPETVCPNGQIFLLAVTLAYAREQLSAREVSQAQVMLWHALQNNFMLDASVWPVKTHDVLHMFDELPAPLDLRSEKIGGDWHKSVTLVVPRCPPKLAELIQERLPSSRALIGIVDETQAATELPDHWRGFELAREVPTGSMLNAMMEAVETPFSLVILSSAVPSLKELQSLRRVVQSRQILGAFGPSIGEDKVYSDFCYRLKLRHYHLDFASDYEYSVIFDEASASSIRGSWFHEEKVEDKEGPCKLCETLGPTFLAHSDALRTVAFHPELDGEWALLDFSIRATRTPLLQVESVSSSSRPGWRHQGGHFAACPHAVLEEEMSLTGPHLYGRNDVPKGVAPNFQWFGEEASALGDVAKATASRLKPEKVARVFMESNHLKDFTGPEGQKRHFGCSLSKVNCPVPDWVYRGWAVPPCCKETMRHLLFYIDAVFKELGVRYIVTDGVLLGSYKFGGMLDWDADVDLHIHNDDFHLLEDVVQHRVKQDGHFLRKHANNRSWLLQANEQNYLLIELNLREEHWDPERVWQVPVQGHLFPAMEDAHMSLSAWYGMSFFKHRLRHVPEWEEEERPMFCSTPYHYNCVDEPNVASGKDCRVAGVC